MFFNKKKTAEGVLSSVTLITKGSTNKGDLVSQDTVHIYGTFEGNLKGTKVVVFGTLEGSVLCDTLIIEKGGKVRHKAQAKEMVVKGTLEGEVSAKRFITKEGAIVIGALFIQSIENKGGSVKGDISTYKEVVEDIFVHTAPAMKENKIARKKSIPTGNTALAKVSA